MCGTSSRRAAGRDRGTDAMGWAFPPDSRFPASRYESLAPLLLRAGMVLHLGGDVGSYPLFLPFPIRPSVPWSFAGDSCVLDRNTGERASGNLRRPDGPSASA